LPLLSLRFSEPYVGSARELLRLASDARRECMLLERLLPGPMPELSGSVVDRLLPEKPGEPELFGDELADFPLLGRLFCLSSMDASRPDCVKRDNCCPASRALSERQDKCLSQRATAVFAGSAAPISETIAAVTSLVCATRPCGTERSGVSAPASIVASTALSTARASASSPSE